MSYSPECELIECKLIRNAGTDSNSGEVLSSLSETHSGMQDCPDIEEDFELCTDDTRDLLCGTCRANAALRLLTQQGAKSALKSRMQMQASVIASIHPCKLRVSFY